jgi:hypothetical protein
MKDADICPNFAKEIFTDKSGVVNLRLCPYIDRTNPDDDIDSIIYFLDQYLVKHNVDFIKIDKSTLNIHLDNLVSEVSIFVNSLSANNFEKLCAQMFKIFEAEDVFVTKQSHDHGYRHHRTLLY